MLMQKNEQKIVGLKIYISSAAWQDNNRLKRISGYMHGIKWQNAILKIKGSH